MSCLTRVLVEHWFTIKSGSMPYKQPARRFNLIIHDRVKEVVERLLDVGFIQSYRYAEYVFNIVPVEKKNTGKIQICIDFRNLNKTTPKDEYPMPITDMLINNASGY
jgi:hypothetical protein